MVGSRQWLETVTLLTDRRARAEHRVDWRPRWTDDMTKDLRQFLETLRLAGPEYYLEARKSLVPDLEVSYLQTRLAEAGRFPAVYCPRIAGSRLPLVSGCFGSYGLLGLALDMTPAEIRDRGVPGVLERFTQRWSRPRRVKDVSGVRAPVQEVVLQGEDVDLSLLPVLKHSPGDSGKYISVGMVVTRDPDTSVPNAGIYRQEVKGKDRLGCRINPSSNGTIFARRHAALKKPMEVVSVIGHHPAAHMAAAYLGPRGLNELELMGGLLGEPLEVTRGVTVDLPVPARAEIAIEGEIDTTEMTMDGPVGEALGYYGEAKSCYVIKVKAITMRRDAIYHDLHPVHLEHVMVGLLPRQADVLGKVKQQVPSVTGVAYAPERALGKLLLFVALKKTSADEGRLAGEAALKADPWISHAVVVDDDVSIYDDQQVWWAVTARARSESSVTVRPPGSEAAGPAAGAWRAVIDATLPLDRPSPRRVVMPSALARSLNVADYLYYPRRYARKTSR